MAAGGEWRRARQGRRKRDKKGAGREGRKRGRGVLGGGVRKDKPGRLGRRRRVRGGGVQEGGVKAEEDDPVGSTPAPSDPPQGRLGSGCCANHPPNPFIPETYVKNGHF